MVCDTGEPLPARLVQSLKNVSFVELHWFLPAALLPPSLRMDDLPHPTATAAILRKLSAPERQWQTFSPGPSA